MLSSMTLAARDRSFTPVGVSALSLPRASLGRLEERDTADPHFTNQETGAEREGGLALSEYLLRARGHCTHLSVLPMTPTIGIIFTTGT